MANMKSTTTMVHRIRIRGEGRGHGRAPLPLLMKTIVVVVGVVAVLLLLYGTEHVASASGSRGGGGEGGACTSGAHGISDEHYAMLRSAYFYARVLNWLKILPEIAAAEVSQFWVGFGTADGTFTLRGTFAAQ